MRSKLSGSLLRYVAGAPAWLAAAALILGGCSTTVGKLAAKVRPTPKPLVRAYVRTRDLEIRHPLQADVQRLQRAEADLIRAATEARGRPVGSWATLELPALTGGMGVGPDAGSAQAAREARRMAARTELQDGFTAQMQSFVDERKRRQQRLEDQRRDELTALDSNKEAASERLARDRIDAELRNSLQGRIGDVTAVEAGLNVLDAQIDPSTLWLDTSSAAKPVTITDYGLFMQALLVQRRETLRAQLKTLRGELELLKQAARDKSDVAAQQVAKVREQAIDDELESLDEDSETPYLVRAQEGSRDRALTTDAALAKRAERERADLIGGAPGTASGPLSLGDIFPAGPGAADPTGALRAAKRIASERARLEQFIRADVTDTVRDVAQRRNLDVLLVSTGVGNTVVAGPDSSYAVNIAGRRDMTAQFALWMEPGASTTAHAPTPLTNRRANKL